jgi:hypothetical protein
MDQKLALLSAIHILDKNQIQLLENTMRQLRIILGQFAEEVISEDEYQELLFSLEDEGFIIRHNDKVLITPAGGALVHAISERIIGQTANARLEDILGDYRKNPSQYIQAISERLSQFHETREEKGKPADKSQIRVVGLLLEIRHKVSELFLHSFKLDYRLIRNEESIDKEINY